MNYLYQIKLDEIDYQITHIIFWGNVRKLQNFALEVGSQIHYFNMPRITLAMSMVFMSQSGRTYLKSSLFHTKFPGPTKLHSLLFLLFSSI